MANSLRVGVIGTGFIGVQHIEAIRRIPNLEVAAIVDNNEEAAKSVSARLGVNKWYQDYQDLLNDPSIDAIHNCTPSAFHFPINEAAIQKGKHVYCEKPLALDAAESERLVALARAANVATGVNFNYRHNAIAQEMRQRVKNDQAGRVLLVTGQYLQDWLMYDTDYDWRLDPKMGGKSRAVADIGSHLFDTSQFIVGKKIASLYAQLFTVYPFRKRAKRGPGGAVEGYDSVPIQSEDAGFIVGKFEDGTPFAFTISQVSAGKKNALSLTVSGSNELLEWDQQRPDILNIGHRNGPNEVLFADAKYLSGDIREYATLPGGHPVGWHDAFTNGIKQFYKSIFNGTYKDAQQNYATFETGHGIMRLVDACLESNESGQWVNL